MRRKKNIKNVKDKNIERKRKMKKRMRKKSKMERNRFHPIKCPPSQRNRLKTKN